MVAFEFWTKHVVGSGQDAQFPWYHFCYPAVVFSLDNDTFQEDFATPAVSGFTRTNEQWGDGPYGDGPPDSTPIVEGGWWLTDVDPPAADCALQTVTATS